MKLIPQEFKHTDKQKHFAVGFLLSIAIGLWLSPPWGMAAGAIAGVGKEAWDYFSKRGVADYVDAIFTILGAVSAGVLLGIFYEV